MNDEKENLTNNKYIPDFDIPHKVFLIFISQITIFLISIVFFIWISYSIWYGAIIGQIIIAFFGTIPYIYMAKNSRDIRKKYLKKYRELAAQKLWYNYNFITIPLQSASLYFPLLLISYDFIPRIIPLESNFFTNSLLPIYLSIPLGILMIIFGFLVIKPSVKYKNNVIGNRLHIIYPEKSKLVTNGIYKFIRNPQYLGRGIVSIGFGFFSNNIIALIVGIIHFISYCLMIPAEDYELSRRFGKEFIKYKRNVPAVFPYFKNWKKILKIVFQK